MLLSMSQGQITFVRSQSQYLQPASATAAGCQNPSRAGCQPSHSPLDWRSIPFLRRQLSGEAAIHLRVSRHCLKETIIEPVVFSWIGRYIALFAVTIYGVSNGLSGELKLWVF